jgi:Alcohol dehydrogenase GroES-like domain
MRGFAILSYGEAPAVHDLAIPDAAGALLVRVSYAGINPLDSKLVERLTATSTYPFVMGIDFAGVIERAAPGGGDLQAGERIFGMARTHGAYAEYTVVAPGVKSEPVARIPAGVTDEQAAALPISATTALRTLELLGLSAGQRLVVMGATGGVGGYAVQMARSRAVHVIATVRGDVDEAHRLGAEEVYDTNAFHVTSLARDFRFVRRRSRPVLQLHSPSATGRSGARAWPPRSGSAEGRDVARGGVRPRAPVASRRVGHAPQHGEEGLVAGADRPKRDPRRRAVFDHRHPQRAEFLKRLIEAVLRQRDLGPRLRRLVRDSEEVGDRKQRVHASVQA